MIHANPSGPGSRPSCAHVIRAPRNDAGVHTARSLVVRIRVVAMRAIRSGSMCLGSAMAISGFIDRIMAASVSPGWTALPGPDVVSRAFLASLVEAIGAQLFLD